MAQDVSDLNHKHAREQADPLARRALLGVGIIGLLMLVSLFLWYVLQVFLLVFAGILLAVLLHIPTDWLSQHTPLTNRWALMVVILAMAAVLGALGGIFVPEVFNQIDQFIAVLPGVLNSVQQNVQQYEWVQQLFGQVPPVQEIIPSASNVLRRVSGVFTGIAGMFASFLIILFIGLYLAVQPRLYINGIVKLFPQQRRPRTRTVLAATGTALKGWLLGQLFAMVVLGTLVGVGLWLLGTPFALTLGIFTGLLSFIPIIGAILAVIPAALVALSQSPTMLLYVLLLYYGVQTLESYVITPMVQQRAVSMPPVLAFVVQLLMGVLAGPLGVALAYPLAVVGMVFVNMLYVEDVLGDTSDIPVAR